MAVGDRIMLLRKERGYSRTEFANKIGIPGTTLRNYELGVREPGHSFLIQMAKEFGVTTDFLLGISDERTTRLGQQSEERITKNASEPEGPEAKMTEMTRTLTNLLIHYGWIKPGEDITDEQLRFFKALIIMVDAYFNT